MTNESKFKTLQSAYTQKKLNDDSYWADLVQDVKQVLEGFTSYIGSPSTYTGATGREEYYLRFISYNGDTLVQLSPRQIQKKGSSFDFSLELALDSTKSDNLRVSEIVRADLTVTSSEKGKLSFLVGKDLKSLVIEVGDPAPFYDAVYEVFKAEIEKPIQFA